MRLAGASYEEIARAGGGILSSVAAVRAASEDELVAASLPRLDALLAEGAGTVEIKSGYGLAIEPELKMLRAARRLAALRPVRVVTTWLAAHATPPEYRGRNAAYVGEVAIPGLEAAHREGLVDAVDGFCETIAFSTDELAPLFERARALGLAVKLHAEQLSNSGGAAFAAGYGALLLRPHRIPRRRRRRRHAGGRHHRRAAARRLLRAPRDQGPAGRRPARGRRPDRARHRPQPRHLAARLAAPRP